jgi:hypothetical protein
LLDAFELLINRFEAPEAASAECSERCIGGHRYGVLVSAN